MADRQTRIVRGGGRLYAAVAIVLVLASAYCSSALAATRSAAHGGQRISPAWGGNLAAPGDKRLVSPLTQLPVQDVSASVSPAVAGATEAVYTVGFTTSAQGALVAGQDTITFEFPGEGAGCVNVTVDDTTSGLSQSGVGADCSSVEHELTVPFAIAAGDHVTLTTTPVSTPTTAGSQAVLVFTSVDGPASGSYSLAAQKPVSAVSASVSPAIAGASQVTYTVGFTTSTQGTLAAGVGRISIGFPGSPGCDDNAAPMKVTDVTTGASVTDQCAHQGDYTVPFAVGPGNRIEVVITGMQTPPTAGSQTVTVSTSSDSVAIAEYTTVAQLPVTDVSASVSSAVAGASQATYTVGFTTSSQGALAAGVDAISVQFTGSPGCSDDAAAMTVTDVTSGATATDQCVHAGYYVLPFSVADGDHLTVVVQGMQAPPTPGSQSVEVSTSSDSSSTAAYITTTQAPVQKASITVNSTAAGASGAAYTVGFTTTPAGALAGGYGTVTIAFPSGTGMPGCGQVEVADVTSGKSATATSCSASGSALTITVPFDVAGGDGLQLALSGMTNPPVSGTQTASISTTSDTVASANYALIEGAILTGDVTYQAPSGSEPIVGSIIQACASSACFGAQSPTDGNGEYTIVVPPGTYTLTAFAPTSNAYSVGQGTDGPLTLTAGTNAAAAITLPALTPLPTGATFNDQSGVVPSVYWGSSAPLSVQGCDGGIGLAYVSGLDEQTGQPESAIGSLAESPVGSGTYVATVPPLYPMHGTAYMSTAIECPTPTALLPSSGSDQGGNSVQISGTGFNGATAVMFGSTPARSFTVASDSSIDAVAPPGAGSVPVTVVTPSGETNSASLADYTYITISSVEPDSGPSAGGTPVTISGTDCLAVRAVYFGDAAAQDVVIDSDNEITAIAPPGSGTAAVTVLTSDGGQSAADEASFSYDAGGQDAQVSRATATLGDGRPPHQLDAANTSKPRSAPDLLGHSPSNTASEAALDGARSASASPVAFSPVSATQQADDVAAQIVDHAVAGCVGTGCSALQGDAPQALSNFEEAVASAGWVQAPPPDSSSVVCPPETPECLTLPPLPSPPAVQPPQGPSGPDYEPCTLPDLDAAIALRGVLSPSDYYLCAPNEIPQHCVAAFDSMYSDGKDQCTPVRVDPSGTVEDTDGNPVPGATVTLLQSDNELGPFLPPPSGSPIMEPSINPETSDSNGLFAWEVFAGFYQVTATKEGCSNPGSPLSQTVSTPVFQVPPPQGNLLLTLSCPDEPPPATPSVSGLSASSGPAAGGTVTDVAGSEFSSASAVSFGGVSASSVVVLSPTEIQATSPAGSGTVEVTVTTAGGTTAASGADKFSYVSLPVVSVVSPATGPTAGGNVVSIEGSGFAVNDQVAFDSAPAQGVTVISPSQIEAVAPAGTGQVDITVTNVAGASHMSGKDQYTYLDVPANAANPTISGTPSVGSTLACSSGTWSNSPTTYAYRWDLDGSPIAGASTATYVVQPADVGHELTCTVVASNAAGVGQPASSSPVTGTEELSQPGGSNTTGSTGSGSASANPGSGGVLANKSVGRPAKVLSPAQELAAAVKACDKIHKGRKRLACIAAAHKRYEAQEFALAIKLCDKRKAGKERATCVAAARKKYH